jgi:hypothetical protein
VSRLLAATLVAAALITGCGHGATTSPPPSLPADALPGHPTTIRSLTAEDLAAEALDPAEASAELDRTGFLAASGRAFAAPDRGVRTVQTRVLRFSSDEGAARYLAWLQQNLGTIIGSGRVDEQPAMPASGFVFLHEPGGCCPKELPVALGVWRRGHTVLWVEAIGDVNAGDAARYATEFDGAIAR